MYWVLGEGNGNPLQCLLREPSTLDLKLYALLVWILLPLSSTNVLLRFLISKVKSLSSVQFFVTPWPVAYLAPPSMGFSRQEYWSRVPLPSPGVLPDPGIEPRSPTL